MNVEGRTDLENCHIAKPTKTTDSHNIRRKSNGKSQIQRLLKYHLYRLLGISSWDTILCPQNHYEYFHQKCLTESSWAFGSHF